LAREQKVGEIFLMLLDRWNGQGRIVSDKKKANNYAPACFADEPETKADKVTKPELAAAMTRLFAADKIRCETYGPPSHQYTKLVGNDLSICERENSHDDTLTRRRTMAPGG
jgi:hypothetical protein